MKEKKLIGAEKYEKWCEAIMDKCTEETFKDVRSDNQKEDAKHYWIEVEHYIIDGLHVYIEYSCTPNERNQGVLTISKNERENYFEIKDESSSNIEMICIGGDLREPRFYFASKFLEVRYEAGDLKYNAGTCWIKNFEDGTLRDAPIIFSMYEMDDYECNPLFMECRPNSYTTSRAGKRLYIHKEESNIYDKTDLEKMGTSLSGTDLGDFELIVSDAIRILTEYLKDKEPNTCIEERAKLASLKETIEFYKSVEKVVEKDLGVEEKPEETKTPEEKLEDANVSDEEKSLEKLSTDELREMLERKEKENEDKRAQIAKEIEKDELIKKIIEAIKEGKKLDEELRRKPSSGGPGGDLE